MTSPKSRTRGVGKPLAIALVCFASIAVAALLVFGATIRRMVRESLMQRVRSTHYEILCPVGALSQSAMADFAGRRESLFTALDKKLGDADSQTIVRIVFDPDFSARAAETFGDSPYSVSGTTIRTKLNVHDLMLPAAADAEALLDAAWGKPGNAALARWTAIWLTGNWHGVEIGMAAAQVEQHLGHKKVEAVLSESAGQISPDDHSLLGAAWISEIAELGGFDAVRKLYAARAPQLTVAEVTKVLGTTPLELDRRWQMWMYAYLAGMPSMPQDSEMPAGMAMPMATGK